MHFQKIKELRVENNKTQKEIAEFLHCNRLVYARYESGKREIPVSMVVKLAEFYNETTDYLLGREDA